jgi:hypothetical protein
MDRKEHLKICKRCANRKFDMNKGIVCGLTNEIANFELNCTDYIADEEAIKREDAIDSAQENTFEARSKTRREELQAKTAELKNQIDPEKVVKGGANWFYWIAGLSLINSLVLLTESEFGFIVGLGITQLFDGIIIEIFGGYSIWSLIPSLGFSLIFTVIGYYANKYSKTAFITGMIFYSLDTLIFLLVSDYLSIGFHVFALFMIYKGYKFLNELKADPSPIVVENN